MKVIQRVRIKGGLFFLGLAVLLAFVGQPAKASGLGLAMVEEKSSNFTPPNAVIVTGGAETITKAGRGAEVLALPASTKQAVCEAWGANVLFAKVEAVAGGYYTAQTARAAYDAADKAYHKCLTASGV